MASRWSARSKSIRPPNPNRRSSNRSSDCRRICFTFRRYIGQRAFVALRRISPASRTPSAADSVGGAAAGEAAGL